MVKGISVGFLEKLEAKGNLSKNHLATRPILAWFPENLNVAIST